MHNDVFHQILAEYWGYTEFRSLQLDIIESISEGQDTLGLMPTGGGKSITFQVPALAKDGICLVVTPLIALMKDQVDNLKERGIKALAIYSGMTHSEIVLTLENAILGDYKFLYISPERLGTRLFQQKLRDMNVSFIVVDESHCISQWGYDFRPSYMNIANIREQLPNIPVLALTATATPEVVNDIQSILHFKTKNVYSKSFERSNIAYVVRYTEDKISEIINILHKISGSGIIYVRSRVKTKEISEILQKSGISTDYYHAGLPPYEKVEKQNAWKSGKSRIIISTNAFGMGIDKADVRVVIHLDLPSSLEEYYQEAGRAGRDGEKAFAIMLYNKNDSIKLKKRVADEFPTREFISNIYEFLAYYFQIAEGSGTEVAHDFDLYHFCSVYKLPSLPTYNALKILQLAEYIEYVDELNSRSRLIFTIDRDDLYLYDLGQEYESLINVILRLYTGLFADYVTIDEAEIGVHLQKNRKEVYEMLKILRRRSVIDYIPFKKNPYILYTKSRVDCKYLSISKAVYENRKVKFQNRISSILEYTERNDICRSKILLSYFGEIKSGSCGKCDVCLNKKKTGLSNSNFQDILFHIDIILSRAEGAISINNLIELVSDYPKDDILTVIRYQVDNLIYEIVDSDSLIKKRALPSK